MDWAFFTRTLLIRRRFVLRSLRLAELRLTAIERRVDADLRAGRHLAVLSELETLTIDHPFRERFRELQMIVSVPRRTSGRHLASTSNGKAGHAGRQTRVWTLGRGCATTVPADPRSIPRARPHRRRHRPPPQPPRSATPTDSSARSVRGYKLAEQLSECGDRQHLQSLSGFARARGLADLDGDSRRGQPARVRQALRRCLPTPGLISLTLTSSGCTTTGATLVAPTWRLRCLRGGIP